jgi:hypothetical protein
MKISKKRFEEILLEEVKVFVQEKKLEEQPKEGAPEVGSEDWEEDVEKATTFDLWSPSTWNPLTRARRAKHATTTAIEQGIVDPAIEGYGKVLKALSEDETNEDCGDMPAPKKTIKIKIKQ